MTHYKAKRTCYSFLSGFLLRLPFFFCTASDTFQEEQNLLSLNDATNDDAFDEAMQGQSVPAATPTAPPRSRICFY
jgi:hypothetical protein